MGIITAPVATGAVMMPIYTSSTFKQESPGVHKGYDYSRSGNPTRKAFEECMASLEDGIKGYGFSSGVAAISAEIAATPEENPYPLIPSSKLAMHSSNAFLVGFPDLE